MRILLAILLSISFTHITLAQYHVRFIVTEKTIRHHDSIYVTGSFSNWDSTANATYRLQPYGGAEKSIVLNLKGGKIEYKFTRGNWFTVEKQYTGFEVPNRIVTITKDTTLQDTIVCYRDEILRDKWQALAKDQPDSSRIHLLGSIASVYAFLSEYRNVDSAFYYTRQALLLLQKYKSTGKAGKLTQVEYAIADLQELSATLLHSLGNYTKALELRLDNLKVAEQGGDPYLMLSAIGNIISDYASMKDYQKVLQYSRQMQQNISLLESRRSVGPYFKMISDKGLAEAYYHLHFLDSSIYYAKQLYTTSYEQFLRDGSSFHMINMAEASLLLGDIYSKKGNAVTAMAYYRTAVQYGSKGYQYLTIARVQESIAQLFQQQGRVDSGLFYARSSLDILKNQESSVQSWGENAGSYIAEISPLVASLYEANHQPDSAYKYLQLSVSLRDSLYNVDKIRQFQNLTFNETVRQQQQEQEAKAAQQRYQNRIRIYLLIAGFLIALCIAFLLWRNNRQKQKVNVVLYHKNAEIEKTLTELKATQAQLVQSEKMASLGELTAGIAHEIQNPLNFVNNFSETNAELIDEAQEELKAGHQEEVAALLNDIKDNEQKINHHGKRADSIVKGMLQHSRTSSGQKEPTNINKLTDEYLRLSYHGLRAKDKNFNAKIETQFDESIGKVNIVPQDIGRVLLNLFNNAFYAVNEKKKNVGSDYEPTVSVNTKRLLDKIEINVQDNGMGISKSLQAKIFQPFFTTKPTGEGTGLGLSLSYDIIKAHGGQIKVESKEGEGSEFIITLLY